MTSQEKIARQFDSIVSVVRALFFLACIGTQVSCAQNSTLLDYGIDVGRRLITVGEAKNTYLIKSSKLFYPNGIPEDPDYLPPLTDDQLKQIQNLIEARLNVILKTHASHLRLIKVQFPTAISELPAIKVIVLKADRPTAGTEMSGRIYIDARVVQSVYRSVLLIALSPDTKTVGKTDKKATERNLFAQFTEFRKELDGVSPLLPLSQITAIASGERQSNGSGVLDVVASGIAGLMNAKLKDSELVGTSMAMEEIFLGSLEFLMAHEVGHLALKHFPVTNICFTAIERENEADKYAVLNNSLAHFDSLPKVVMTYDGWGKISGGPGRLENQGVLSFAHFFGFAYELAGFDSMISAQLGCQYPSPEQRFLTVEFFATTINELIRVTRITDSWHKSGDPDFVNEMGNTVELVSKKTIDDVLKKPEGVITKSDKPVDLDRIGTTREFLDHLFRSYYSYP
ncbi:hypothetical protein [Undibacterium sp.]|uniref:hypothetical protein n=1 Tax=Undibacterium sp. TaxID=1914977 RepID=UPI0025EBF76F|nr:hypothetical protein [Undibacterium sp.]